MDDLKHGCSKIASLQVGPVDDIAHLPICLLAYLQLSYAIYHTLCFLV